MQIKYRNGQIGLMLLIVMGIVVSIVLSLASRVITDTTLSRQERENNASFAIAESGVEKALLGLSQGTTTVTGVAIGDAASLVTGAYDVTELNSYDMYLKEGETAQIDLTGSPSPTSVTINWVKPGEDPGTCTEGSGTAPSAIEVTVFDGTGQASRSYYNPSSCPGLATANNFATSTAITGQFTSSQTISFAANQKMMRIKPLYNGTTINVTGANLVSQLYLIESHASGGDARSDIQATRTKDAPGSVFDFAVFSNTTITKP